jgi:hypothetical protein
VSPNSSYYLSDQIEDEFDEKKEDKINETQYEDKTSDEDLVKNIEPIFFTDDGSVDMFQYELEVTIYPQAYCNVSVTLVISQLIL